MNDELKLGLYSVRDDTSILDIQSSDLNAYIFSTRDDPSIFEAAEDDGLMLIYDNDFTAKQTPGGYWVYLSLSDLDFSSETYADAMKIVLNGETYLLPNFQNNPVFGEFINPDTADYTNYPLAIMLGSKGMQVGLKDISTGHIKVYYPKDLMVVTPPV